MSMTNEEKVKKAPGIKSGRPDEIKLPLGLRMYPSDRQKIEKKYGCKIQQFFDRVVEKEISDVQKENA